MKKISKTALVGGVAAAAVAASVGVAAPANAREAQITTVVTWIGGNNWLAVDYAGEGVVMEGSPTKTATDTWYAISGAQIGADPIMGDADFISCHLYVNGRLVAADSAPPAAQPGSLLPVNPPVPGLPPPPPPAP